MANTWRLSGVDPYSYEQKQLQECEGGIAGSRGRYAARKRTAMLHNRLTAMSEQLDPDWHPTKYSQTARIHLTAGPTNTSTPPRSPISICSPHSSIPARKDGEELIRRSSGLDEKDSDHPRASCQSSGDHPRSSCRSSGSRSLHEGQRPYKITEPPAAKWSVLGPTPEPPDVPASLPLTPRAQQLAIALDHVIHREHS